MTEEVCPYCDKGFGGLDHSIRCRDCDGTGIVQPREEYPDPRDDEDWKRHAE